MSHRSYGKDGEEEEVNGDTMQRVGHGHHPPPPPTNDITQ